ncbi:MAG: DNA alkylation repair protein [Patescibacteria group bacterium]
MADDLRKELQKLADKKKAKILQRFFKTGKGEYGEGDLFLGVTVPELRKIAAKYKHLELSDLAENISSKFHEERLACLLILLEKLKKLSSYLRHGVNMTEITEEAKRKQIFDFYIKNRKHVNSWGLVDLTAPKIAGAYLENKDKSLLYKFARSEDLWEKRMAMLSTFYYIQRGNCKDALRIAEILKDDKHDLIQKAVGWMLREVGKRCGKNFEEEFLKKYYKTMPRTMLRYAIEKFPEKERKQYLNKQGIRLN